MNVIPACLFFFFLLSMVDLEAVRLGLKGMPTEDIPSVRRVLAEGWHFILPLGVIIGLLFAGYSPEFCAFWGTVSAAVLSWRLTAPRMGPSDGLNELAGAAQSHP